jgi:hypothetical protein
MGVIQRWPGGRSPRSFICFSISLSRMARCCCHTAGAGAGLGEVVAVVVEEGGEVAGAGARLREVVAVVVEEGGEEAGAKTEGMSTPVLMLGWKMMVVGSRRRSSGSSRWLKRGAAGGGSRMSR